MLFAPDALHEKTRHVCLVSRHNRMSDFYVPESAEFSGYSYRLWCLRPLAVLGTYCRHLPYYESAIYYREPAEPSAGLVLKGRKRAF